MPKLRRLNGKQVVDIFRQFGFEVVRIRGSHTHLQRIVSAEHQNLNVPVHGSKPIPTGTLKSILRQASAYLSDEELKKHFYGD